mgnify:CR=1 FL=1
MKDDKQYKTEIANKLIDLKKENGELKEQNKKTNIRINRLENEMAEHRKTINQVKRSVWEVFEIATGNRKKVEDLSRRVDDTTEKYDRIQETINWISKLIIGLIITSVITAALNTIFGVF